MVLLINRNIVRVNGTKPPYEWLAKKVKEYAKDYYGLDVKVAVKPEYLINPTHKNIAP